MVGEIIPIRPNNANSTVVVQLKPVLRSSCDAVPLNFNNKSF
jgi:hypothetical protein